MNLSNITSYINENATSIINNLDHESVEVHAYLMRMFKGTDLSNDLPFQFLYRSFYRLDNAGLTTSFKTAYFRVLQEERNNQILYLKVILEKFRGFPNRQGQDNVQFSFTTKLANTINSRYPIYDSEVARVFGYSRPTDRDFGKKVEEYRKQFQHIQDSYEQILSEGLLAPAVQLFDTKFKGHDLPEMKRLDFIFWSAGKLVKKEDLMAKKSRKLLST